jgi:epoxyqueuosine reductase QueG
VTDCAKAPYPTQAQARAALARIIEKWGEKPRPKMPVRVYPCDRCPAWHTTSKRVKRKPPWDKDPNWERPNAPN